jgi:hypothetical protein
MVEHITALFPRLVPSSFQVTSVQDAVYNCIAWAAGVTNAWWWPLPNPADAYWPAGIARVRTLEVFREVFESLGYSLCPGEALEAGFEKIALFADVGGLPTHAARQLANGRWTSKLGKAEDIEHNLNDLEGDLYGKVVLVMKRSSGTGQMNSGQALGLQG